MADLNEYNSLVHDARERTIAYKRDRSDDDTVRTFVVEDDGRFVAYATGEVHASPPIFSRDNDLRIVELYVAEAYRRQGLATEILEQLIDWGKDVGCETVSASVDTGNDVAKQPYDVTGLDPERQIYRRSRSSASGLDPEAVHRKRLSRQ